MALPDIDVGYRNSGSIVIKEHFPDLKAVENLLFPSAKSERVSLSTYREALRLQGRLTPPVQESIEKAAKIREETVAICYIAGGLTGVDEATKLRYGEVSNFLNTYGGKLGTDGKLQRLFFGYVPHLHGTDPVKHPSVTPDEVRDIDHLWAVIVADFGINFKHPMAQGNAIEAGWEESHLIPEVQQNLKGNKLSRLVLGMNNLMSQQEYPEIFTIERAEELKLLMDEYSAWLKTFSGRDPREFYYMSPQNLRTSALIKNGTDPKEHHRIFSVGQFLVYVKDPSHSRYSQVGEYTGYDRWGGMHHVKFSDGREEKFYDGFEKEYGGSQVSFWLK